MAMQDLMLKAKVNLALARDHRVSALDIGVACDDGLVTLTGDLDTPVECQAAAQIAGTVEGVRSVRNELTCGIGAKEDTAEFVRRKLLERLDGAWDELPDRTALMQADYLRWACWMVYKFRLPAHLTGADRERLEAEAVEEAIGEIAAKVGAPKAIVALQMMREAELICATGGDAPDMEVAPLTATPMVTQRAA